MASKKHHYIDNDWLLSAIIQFQTDLEQAEKNGKPEPLMPDDIGEAIVKISTNFAFRPNFINYSYRDDMIGDGIESCILGVKKFDHKRFSNPFAYLTQCCFFAFITRIKREKKQQYVRSEMIKSIGMDVFSFTEATEYDGEEGDTGFRNDIVEFLNSNLNVDGSFLQTKKKEKKIVVGPLEDFVNV